MDSYIFLDFDENIKLKEYDFYKRKMIKTLKNYGTILTKDFNPNITSKCFSVHISLGKEKQTNLHYQNLFYTYIEYKSSFPSIDGIAQKILQLYSYFARPMYPLQRRMDIIVFDMDETLIDKNLKPFYNDIFKELELYRNYFTFIVLWTHGTTTYLADIKLLNFKFDLYISRSNEDSENKGLGAILVELNKTYGIKKLDFCVLVDDSSFNFKNDYDLFVNVNKTPICGSYKATLKDIVYCMDRYYNQKQFANEIYINNNNGKD